VRGAKGGAVIGCPGQAGGAWAGTSAPDCCAVAPAVCACWAGLRVALVGERLNLGDRVERPWSRVAAAALAGGQGDVLLDYLVRLAAFREGHGRARLWRSGLRWSAALNLLPPGRVGAWDAGEAREVAALILAPLVGGFDLVVLVGQRVAAAFGVRLGLCQTAGLFAVFPHPSGRSRLWRQRAAEFQRFGVGLGEWTRQRGMPTLAESAPVREKADPRF
jgi:hypothetical protein